MRRSDLILTTTICERTKPGGTKKVLWDAKVLGLALVIRPTGKRSWFFVCRRQGQQVWVKIGEYHKSRSETEKDDVWTLDAARAEAGKLRKCHDEGKDVRAIITERRNPDTFSELVEDFKDATHWRGLAPGSVKKYLSYLTLHIEPVLGKRLVKDISYKDITAMQRTIEKKQNPHISTTAGFCVALVSKILDHAMKAGWRERGLNPAKGVEIASRRVKNRVLAGEELSRIGDALGEGANAAVIRLMAVSGMRIGEVVGLERKGIDFENRILTIEKHKTMRFVGPKQLPINGHMDAILRAQIFDVFEDRHPSVCQD